MIDITIIVGLPGSGKTMLARDMAREHGAEVIDDIAQNLDRISSINQGKKTHLIITDTNAVTALPSAVEGKLREWFGHDAEITFIAFENDLPACLDNVKARSHHDDRVISAASIKAMSLRYNPEDFSADIRAVWKPNPQKLF